jgi:uncharacterized iron-regulated membrane protein
MRSLMQNSSFKSLQTISQQWHRALGIVMAGVMLMFTLTGMVLLWDQQLQPQWAVAYPVSSQGLQLAPSELLDRIQQQFPDGAIEWLDLPQRSTDPAMARLRFPARSRLDLVIDPHNANVLAQRSPDRAGLHWIHRLHGDFLLGKWGKWLVGLSGVGLLVVSFTGLWRWTGWRQLSNGFRIRWQAKPQAVNYDVHNVGGLLVLAFLLIIAATGSFMGLHGPIAKLLPTAPKAITKPQFTASSRSPLPLDQLLQTAQQDFPDAVVTRIHPAQTLKNPVKIHIQAAGLAEPIKLSFNPYSGEILQIENPNNMTGMRWVKRWVDRLHTAKYGSIGVAWLYLLLTGLSLVVSATGLGIWGVRTQRLIPKKVKPLTPTIH